jgi:hypothetical protein
LNNILNKLSLPYKDLRVILIFLEAIIDLFKSDIEDIELKR